MLRCPIAMGVFNPCASTASAALMNGWINSIFILGSCAGSLRDAAIFSQHVLDDFVQYFRLNWLLYKVTRATLQRRHNVLLIPDRRHHDDARFSMLLNDL